MFAWLGLLITIDRLAPGSLPAPATAAARERALDRQGGRLFHICAEHHHMSDPRPCHAGCRTLCGALVVRAHDPVAVGRGGHPDLCVVCRELCP